jgi:hypothetical protein
MGRRDDESVMIWILEYALRLCTARPPNCASSTSARTGESQSQVLEIDGTDKQLNRQQCPPHLPDAAQSYLEYPCPILKRCWGIRFFSGGV